jgi:hypothetical protein
VGGLAQGPGIAQWSTNGKATLRFEGTFVEGLLEGEGKMIGADGDRYEGEYRRGLRHGHGIYSTAAGERYEGEYLNNQRAAADRGANAAIAASGLPPSSESSRTATKASPPTPGTTEKTPRVASTQFPSLDGDWYNEQDRFGIRIEAGVGKVTLAATPQLKSGDQVLKVEREENGRLIGKIMLVSPNGPSWFDFTARVASDRLNIAYSSIGRMSFVRGAPPTLSSPYPSGASFILGSCGRDPHAAAVVPKPDIRLWPEHAQYPSASAAPKDIASVLQDGRAFLFEKCPELNDKSNFKLFLFATKLPNLQPRDYYYQLAEVTIWVASQHVQVDSKLAEQARFAKERDVQRQNHEAQVAAAKAVQARRNEFVQKFSAQEMSDSDLNTLHVNPFAFEGKNVALDVNFRMMEDATTAEFEQLAGMQFRATGSIVATGVPKGTFAGPTQALLIGKVIGRKQDPQGISSLHVKFVAAKICDKNDCF